MSTATATSIAALAGLFGAVIGGLLAGRQQRSAQLRDRMLDVALEYVEVLHAAVPDVLDEPQPKNSTTHAVLERAHRLSHRAVLLFGPDSAAGEQATRAYFATLFFFEHAHQPLEIEERVRGGESIAREIAQGIWLADHQQAEAEAERAVHCFSTLAGRSIRSGGRHPWLDQGRRMRRGIFQTPGGRRVMRELREVSAQIREHEGRVKKQYAEFRKKLDQAEAEDSRAADP
ncbi:MAG TPA: hypothetical protein VNM89_01330 [Solirubrobacterales bacterium]|nr:hypothetical protein [Solirubrobacterales bacterium]